MFADDEHKYYTIFRDDITRNDKQHAKYMKCLNLCIFIRLSTFVFTLFFFYFFIYSVSRDPPKKVALRINSSAYCSTGYTWFEQTNHCYRASPIGVTFKVANESCHADQAHLTSIHSELENVFIAGLYHKSITEVKKTTFLNTKHFILIGLHKPNTTWEWMDGSQMSFSNFATGENTDNTSLSWVTISTWGSYWTLRNEKNDNEFGFVCKKASRLGIQDNVTSPAPSLLRNYDKCSMGYDWLETLGYCYEVLAVNSTFAEAERSCKENNANLVSIHSELENILLTGLIMKAYGHLRKEAISDLWIGLTVQDRKYTWTDGSAVDFVDWFPSEPAYRKGEDTFQWNFWEAWQPVKPSLQNGFICKMREYSG